MVVYHKCFRYIVKRGSLYMQEHLLLFYGRQEGRSDRFRNATHPYRQEDEKRTDEADESSAGLARYTNH